MTTSTSKIKGYIDNVLFIKSHNIKRIKYALEQELKYNGASQASYYIPDVIFGTYNYIDASWVQE